MDLVNTSSSIAVLLILNLGSRDEEARGVDDRAWEESHVEREAHRQAIELELGK